MTLILINISCRKFRTDLFCTNPERTEAGCPVSSYHGSYATVMAIHHSYYKDYMNNLYSCLSTQIQNGFILYKFRCRILLRVIDSLIPFGKRWPICLSRNLRDIIRFFIEPHCRVLYNLHGSNLLIVLSGQLICHLHFR